MTDTTNKQLTYGTDGGKLQEDSAQQLNEAHGADVRLGVEAAHLLRDMLAMFPLHVLTIACRVLVQEEAQWHQDQPEVAQHIAPFFDRATAIARPHYHQHAEEADESYRVVSDAMEAGEDVTIDVELPAGGQRFLVLAEGSKLKN